MGRRGGALHTETERPWVRHGRGSYFAGPMGTDVLAGFDKTTFTFGGKTRDVYRMGSGPAVIVNAEMPGITPKVIEWLRALARSLHEECGGPGVGVVGMCFTGGFALAMMADAPVLAPVLSQPSLPFGIGAKRKRDLGLSDADLDKVKVKCAAEDLTVLGLRFSGDRFVPPERFGHLREALGDRFVGVEIDSSKGNAWGHRAQAHSVLTEDLQDTPGTPTRDALDQVLDLFRKRLLT